MAMLTIAEGLMHTIANCDNSKTILRYLLTCEPPSYTCGRYWDWIEPHIIEHIQSCSDNVHIMQNREEMEISLRILALLEKIKTQDRELIEATDGLAGRQIPEPYLIWDILGSNEFDNKQTEDGSVHVVQHELIVNVSKSRPTGSGNDSIHKVWTGHRLGFVPKRIKTRRKKPRKWALQPAPGQPLLQAQGDAKPSRPKASTAKDRQLDSDQVRKRHERREKAGLDGEDADEEESDDAAMNEQEQEREQANDRGQPDEMPV